MELKERTNKKITIEIPLKDVDKDGFDKIWDKIRNAYKETEYTIEKIERKINHLEVILKKIKV